MKERVFAIYAHPDDEVLGAGATLARHASGGDEVCVLLLATGLAARGEYDRGPIAVLREDARRAADVLGAASVDFADFPDNAMDTVPLLDVIQRIESFLSDRAPTIVYTHHGGDLNVDHRIVHQATVTALRPLAVGTCQTVLAGEVNSSTEWAPRPLEPFVPTEFVDVTSSIDTKVQALECYTTEIRAWPHPRSAEGVRALARWRGAQSGFDAAEAFVTVRRTFAAA